MKKENMQRLKKRLLTLLKQKAFKKGKFVLSSGKTSNYYLDGRSITLDAEGAYLIASLILDMIKRDKIDAVGGPTLGADPIVGALAALSYINKNPLKTFIVRKTPKTHGMNRQIEGPALKKGERVVLVDDVATTGEALMEAKQALSVTSAKIVKVIVVVDRCEGAKENLAKEGLKLESIFSRSEIIQEAGIADFGI